MIYRVVRRILPLVLTACALSGVAFPQRKRAPRFEDYPVKERFHGKPARINFRSYPQGRMFRTMLKETAALGANFAGHYAVNRWGCGTECLRIGIVNLKTGQIYLSPFLVTSGVDTRINSRLLIADSPERIKGHYGDAPPEYVQTQFYVWDGKRLVLVYPPELKGKIPKIF